MSLDDVDDGPDEGGGDEGDSSRLGAAEREELFAQALQQWDRKNYQFGDTIPVEWFYEVLGCANPREANSIETIEARQRAFMIVFHGPNGFRRYILEHRQRALKANNARGYQVLRPEEQTGYAQQKRKRDIKKALQDENALLVNVDAEHLSSRQQQDNADAVARNIALEMMLSRKRPGFSKDKE